MNARLQNINEMENLVRGVDLMEHSLRHTKDDLTMFLIENRLILNEWSWPSWKSIKKGFHTAMDFVQMGAAAISLASYSSVVGAPIGLVASLVDAAIDVGYAVGHGINGDWGKASGRLAWAAVGLIPIAGDSATMAKVAGKTMKTIDAASGAVKQIDKGLDIAKTFKAGDTGKDIAKALKGTKKLKGFDGATDLAKQLTSNSGWASKGALNVIDKIGNSKYIKNSKMFGSLANYADNYKIANASFATLDSSGKTIAKYATGGTQLVEPVTDLGKRMFGTGVWGGGSQTSAIHKAFQGAGGQFSDLANITQRSAAGIDGLKNAFKNPIKFTRSMLFPTGDLSMNLGKSSNLLRATEDVVSATGEAVKQGSKIDFNIFKKIANSKRLRSYTQTAGKFKKINQLPGLFTPFQGDIKQWNARGERDDSDWNRRTLLQLGPDFLGKDISNIKIPMIPGGGINLSNIGGGSLLKPGELGTPEKWQDPMKGAEIMPFPGQDSALSDYEELMNRKKDLSQKNQVDTLTTKDIIDAETELKKQQQKAGI